MTVEDGWAKLGAALEIPTVSHDGDDKVKDDVAGRLENDAFPTSPRPARPSVARTNDGMVDEPVPIPGPGFGSHDDRYIPGKGHPTR